MSFTHRFREQHADLLKIMKQITPHLNLDELNINVNIVRLLLSKLLGKLAIHLVMEDKSLYPEMLASNDERVKKSAKKFMKEMGGLAEAVTAYKKKWPSDLPIKEEPAEFIAETKVLFVALTNRIERENNELYKMLDEL